MNRNTVIAKINHQNITAEWDEIIRDSYPGTLPDLDAAHIFIHENGPVTGEHIEMLTLIYRHPSNRSTHRNTHWFLIDPATDRVQYFNQQEKMFMAVLPRSGICYTLWRHEGLWTEVVRSPYAFRIERDTNGTFVNMAEAK